MARSTLFARQRTGPEAVAAFAELRPDCVVLDVEMPIMGGLEAVTQIRKIDQSTPIVMFSSLTSKGAESSLDAIIRGATDVAVKPSNVGHIDQALEFVRRELVPKVKFLGRRAGLRKIVPIQSSPVIPVSLFRPKAPAVTASRPEQSNELRPTTRPPLPPSRAPFDRTSNCDLVAIGASTGGPNALAEVIKGLNPRIDAPIVIVQHMPPMFTKLLAERLDGMTDLSVREAVDGARLQAGDVWIAPGNYHMVVERSGTDLVIGLHQDAPVNSCRPAVDTLFASVAKVFGSRALGVVLTGMGRDGRDGAALMRSAGGRILAQDEASCVVYGMPRAVAEANLAERLVPLQDISAAINGSCRARGGMAMAVR